MTKKTKRLYKEKQYWKILGLMSGTSLDGLDLACVTLTQDQDQGWHFTIQQTHTYPYSKEWTQRLSSLISLNDNELDEVDKAYTLYLATRINEFISSHNITELDAICSHGHTALHKPHKKNTYQIGNRPELASLVGIPLVCDFRKQDVAFGGQGAPLVPIGDKELFNDFDACLNLGGFANVSLLFAREDPIAFDVGGMNLVLNYLSEKLGKPFDEDGKIAQKGNFIERLFQSLEALPYYAKNPPKSLGVEWLEKEVYPIIEQSLVHYEVADVMHTYACHIAHQLARVFENTKTILCTGGGTYNRMVMAELQSQIKGDLQLPSRSIIEFKEALIFGFLGVLRLMELPNCLSSVTGAVKNHSSGAVYFP